MIVASLKPHGVMRMAKSKKSVSLKSDIPASNTKAYKANEYAGQDYCTQLIDWYGALAEKLKMQTVWSDFTIRDFRARAFEGKIVLTYDGGWGTPGQRTLHNPTWFAIWRAANELIVKSGDTHHVFLEGFTRRGDRVAIATGS